MAWNPLKDVEDFVDDTVTPFAEDYGVQIVTTVGASVAGFFVGGPMGAVQGAALGYQMGQTGKQTYEAKQDLKDQRGEATRISAENKARERSALIQSRQAAKRSTPRVQYGGATYGSGPDTDSPPGLETPSLMARDDLTGLRIVNPSLTGAP